MRFFKFINKLVFFLKYFFLFCFYHFFIPGEDIFTVLSAQAAWTTVVLQTFYVKQNRDRNQQGPVPFYWL